MFAGEPTTVGDGYARTLSTLTWRVVTNATKLPGLSGWRRPQAELDESSRAAALEALVDLHTFTPGDLERMATNAGAVQVETATEEFTAAMLGWPLRTFECVGAARAAGLGLGEVRVHQLEDAELGGRQRLAARGCRRAGSTT